MASKTFALVLSLITLLTLACNLTALLGSQPTPTAIDLPPTQLPSATPVTEEEQEVIYISQPGSGSQVVSPVMVQGEADSTFEQNLVIHVTGEDGSLLAEMPTTIQTPLGERGPFSQEVTFSVSEQQAGRISIFSASAMDGSLEHLSSAEVILLPSGAAQITQASTSQESIDILEPLPLAEISGGSVAFSGFSDYYFESTLGVALCGAGDGSGNLDLLCGTTDNLLAQSSVIIEAPDIGQPGPYAGEIAYSVSATTPARLVIYASSPRDGGLIHVNSIPIQLQP